MGAARQRVRWIKVAAFLVSLAPLLWLLFDIVERQLPKDPVAAVINRLGYWSLVLLLASLACTPLKLLLGWKWPLHLRRMLGLFAFFYGTLHLAVYLGIDKELDPSDVLDDVVKRKFITVGMLTWALLVPLAVTSTTGWVRRLGFRRWNALHRLVYLASLMACVHFLWRGKVISTEPVLFAAVGASLLFVRLVNGLRARRPAAVSPQA